MSEATIHRRKTPEIPQEIRDEIASLKKQGYGKRKIAERIGHSSKEVAKVLRAEGLLPPPAPAASKLEPFHAEIVPRVQKGLTTSRILREIRGLGYQGGRTILATHVATLRTSLTLLPKSPTKRRFETAPGEETQIDFSPYSVRIAGRLVRVHAFAVLLCFSRKLYLRFFREERTSTVLEGLVGAFEYFDGVTLRVVMDNMTAAVLGRVGKDREVLWQPRLLDCARHYGFEPVACAVRDPDRKGKDEKIFRLVEDDFVRGSEFESWEDLECRCGVWLDQTPGAGNLRVHGTTRRVPNEVWEQEERALLIRLPEARFVTCENEVREVDRDSTLSVRGTRYTVPCTLAGSCVAVRLFADHFEVLDRQQRVAFARRYVPDSQKGTLIIDPTHYATMSRRPKGQSPGRLDESFTRRFPDLAPLVDGLKRRYKTLAHIQLRALLRLCDRYGQDDFMAAARRAQEYRRFDAGAVERILESDCPLPPESAGPAPLDGAGPALLGEVEPPSLDSFKGLDEADASSQPPAVTSPAKKDEGGNHGA
ncbi:MAG TPA: IS21 family transposase [Rhodoglobus sp.]|nr:IS21 family transposase [Rhodoglobus sp.]